MQTPYQHPVLAVINGGLTAPVNPYTQQTTQNQQQPGELGWQKDSDLKIDCVRQYTAAGLALFALTGGGPAAQYKAPISTGWHHTVYDPKLVASQLPVIYGVVLTDDLVVVDFDPRRGVAHLVELWNRLGLPNPIDTFIVTTGSGGCHIYFRKPKDWPVVSRLTKQGYDAIELKSRGKFVVAPGSLHWLSGKDYVISRGSPDRIAPCPQALLDFIKAEPLEIGNGTEFFDDSEGNQNNFIQYIMQSAPPAISGAGGDLTTVKVALMGRDYGLSAPTTYELMLEHYNPLKCRPAWDDNDMKTKVISAYKSASGTAGSRNAENDFAGVPVAVSEIKSAPPEPDPRGSRDWGTAWDTDGRGKLQATMYNIASYLMMPMTPDKKSINPLMGVVAYDEFADQVKFAKQAPWHKDEKRIGSEWEDDDTGALELYLSQRWHFNAQPAMIDRGVMVAAKEHTYHPVKNYVLSITWDGVPRIDQFLPKYAGSPDNAYTREIGKNTLIASIARIWEPGCKHDSMLVFEGDQKAGKGEFVRALAGEHIPSQRWFADIPIDPKDKDMVDKLIGVWFAEASEMEFLKRTEINAFKRWMTVTRDKVRLAYKRRSKTYARQSILIGTFNPEQDAGYLTDETGNRRFWPVTIGKLEIEALKRDRDQLFAEALHRYRKGELYHITDPAIEAWAKREQSARMSGDIWHEIIHQWLLDAGVNLPLLTVANVALYALQKPLGQLNSAEARRIGRALRTAGYFPVVKNLNGMTTKVWHLDPFHGLDVKL